MPSADVRTAQRERIARAIVSVAAERGYADTTVGDVVSRARVSRSSFYAQFADKNEAFFAATADGRRLMFARISASVQAAADTGADDLAVLRAGLRAFVEFLRDEPEFAAVFYLELPTAGRRGGDRLDAAQRKLAQRTAVWHERARRRHPDWPAARSDIYLALTGATEQLVRDRVRAGRAVDLPDLEDVVVDLHMRVLGIPILRR